jgi:MFS family permease
MNMLLIHVGCLATIVNSDMIPFRKRGIYQVMQNAVAGFGTICGAIFGGFIADHIGWRWCFYLQVPVSTLAPVLGALVLRDLQEGFEMDTFFSQSTWSKVDISGAPLLVTGISLQLVSLTLGGNEVPRDSPWVISCLVAGVALSRFLQLWRLRWGRFHSTFWDGQRETSNSYSDCKQLRGVSSLCGMWYPPAACASQDDIRRS